MLRALLAMRTHGSMREKSLSLIISKITLGLFIVLTVWRITEVTGEGNTFGAFERRKVLPEEASQSLIGRSIMDPAQN